ncbi:unnamed protein product [Peronospora belbahrii]|uniref:Uncharacterized protein n=1 Tax=Peronospora belbahrii TaxID=622444 RepID=A0AAU9KRV9_9STRA|nr:unnamed protein product [Peronospora belbahrii]
MASPSSPAISGDTLSSATEPRLPFIIYEGDTVICQTSDGRMFFQTVNKDESIRVGKKVSGLKPVIGSYYGAIFEEQNQKLVKVTGGLFPGSSGSRSWRRLRALWRQPTLCRHQFSSDFETDRHWRVA